MTMTVGGDQLTENPVQISNLPVAESAPNEGVYDIEVLGEKAVFIDVHSAVKAHLVPGFMEQLKGIINENPQIGIVFRVAKKAILGYSGEDISVGADMLSKTLKSINHSGDVAVVTKSKLLGLAIRGINSVAGRTQWHLNLTAHETPQDAFERFGVESTPIDDNVEV